MGRPDYRDARRHQREQLAAHRANPPKGCRCADCLGIAGIHELLMDRVRAQRERIGEAPF